jgi:hypothetical protein
MAKSCNISHSFEEHFSSISDPREGHKTLYPLKEVLLITVCAVIGGADGWVDIETFGKAKKDFFKKFVPLKYGVPSHDTFGDVFAAIAPEEFKKCLLMGNAFVIHMIQPMTSLLFIWFLLGLANNIWF